MEKLHINEKKIKAYQTFLFEEERSEATISKYMRDIRGFYKFLNENQIITKESLVNYKQYLTEQGYQLTSINSMLVAINGLLDYLGLAKLKLKLYKIQRKSFYEEDKELTKQEYKRLLDTALLRNNKRLYTLIQTICGTGIRVSEHQYITVEALQENKAIIHNKGKVRVIFIPEQLKKLLQQYCRNEGIQTGAIFITRSGKPMNRSNIWGAMKELCENAQVDQHKVFPHNLRHLFAITYYRLQKDVVRLADILGHASIETTRIYTMTSGKECAKSLSKMDLVMPFLI